MAQPFRSDAIANPQASFLEVPIYCSSFKSKKKSRLGEGLGGWMGCTLDFPSGDWDLHPNQVFHFKLCNLNKLRYVTGCELHYSI